MAKLKKKKNKDYSLYSAEDFLDDDFFIMSMKYPTNKTIDFWRNLLETGIVDVNEYNLARCFIEAVQVYDAKLDTDEKEQLVSGIKIRSNIYYMSRKKQRAVRMLLATAASFAVLIMLSALYFFEHNSLTDDNLMRIEDVVAPVTNADNIQLVLASDQAISLEGEEAEIAYNESGIAINRQTTELAKQPKTDEMVYNQLIVPKGKRSMLTLADGTRMWVNALTRVVYPVVFDSREREIYINGEAFLEVAHIDNCPFVVKTKTFYAEVLGTSFNVNAYETDEAKSLVLVTGSVKINDDVAKKKDILLVPNEMFTSAKGIVQVKTVHADYYISWKSGLYQYESEPLGSILIRLSRYYGEEIAFDSQVADLRCSGKLDLKDRLDDVLQGIALTAPVIYRSGGGRYSITNN